MDGMEDHCPVSVAAYLWHGGLNLSTMKRIVALNTSGRNEKLLGGSEKLIRAAY